MMTCLVDSRADPLSQNRSGAIAALTDDHINNARRRGWNRILALTEETAVAVFTSFTSVVTVPSAQKKPFTKPC